MYQATRTGVPLAAMARALASASDSGNKLSAPPWINRVGAVTRSSTPAGLDSRSRATAAGSPRPVTAIRS